MLLFEKKIENYTFQSLDQRPAGKVYEVKQVHGNKVYSLDKLKNTSTTLQADGIYTNELSSSILAIKTADCLPIFIIGKNGIALLHAGWRGIQKKIHLQREVLDLRPQTVFVGAHIQFKSFQVGKDFYSQFPGSLELFKREGDKIYFNLFGQIYKDFKQFDSLLTIINSNIDTFSNKKFFSFRRNNTSQRIWNIVRKHTLNG